MATQHITLSTDLIRLKCMPPSRQMLHFLKTRHHRKTIKSLVGLFFDQPLRCYALTHEHCP